MTRGWHRDYEPFELAENMEEDLGLFEAATHVRHFAVEQPVLRAVLVATAAGSGCLDFAAGAARRLKAELVTDTTAATAEAILAAAARTGSGLVVVPAAIGGDELCGLVASTVDGPSPAVAVVSSGGASALDAILLPLFCDEPAARVSLAWACTFAAAAGSRGLVSAVELSTPATRREARGLAGDTSNPEEVREATVGRAVSAHLGSLVATLQRHAIACGYAVDVGFRPGLPRREILASLASLARPATVILGRDGVPAAQGKGQAQGLACRLALALVGNHTGAVLVV
jgi:hypothetical protein